MDYKLGKAKENKNSVCYLGKKNSLQNKMNISEIYIIIFF